MKKSEATSFEFTADESDSKISAQEIINEISSGKSVYVTGATITGPFTLSYETIKVELVLRGCTVAELFEARNAIFERRVDINETDFKARANFEGAIFQRYLNIEGSSFQSGADFTLARFSQGISLSSTSFVAEKVEPEVPALSLTGAKVGAFMFLTGAMVEGRLECAFMEVMGNCNGAGLRCRGAKVNFKGLTVMADTIFENAIFEGETDFGRMQLSGSFNLRSTQFLGMKEASEANQTNVYANTFYGTSVGFDAFFEGAWFKDNVSLQSLTIYGSTYFGLKYSGETQTMHNAARFGGTANFGGSEFKGPCYFFGCEIDGQASFSDVVFGQHVGFVTRFNCKTEPVIFSRARFADVTAFDSHFAGGVSFFDTHFTRSLHFSGSCAIEQRADFRGAKAYAIHFTRTGNNSRPPMPFGGEVDLRHCHYQVLQHDEGGEGIRELWVVLRDKWRQQAKPGATQSSFDVQPYEQLERVCRKQVLDELADDIYYEMRSIAHRFETRIFFRMWDWIECRLFGWGVKPLRMVGQFVIFWAIGTCVFWLPETQTALEVNSSPPVHPSFYTAMIISLRNLVPGLGELKTLGLGSAWPNPVAAICTILQHLVGWMLLALLAKRFFAGLSRAVTETAEE